MQIDIYTPKPDVPAHIIRYIKEMIRLATLQDFRIENAKVTLRETPYFDTNWYTCEVGFTVNDQPFLITKKANCYLGAVYDASQALFTKVNANTQFHYN